MECDVQYVTDDCNSIQFQFLCQTIYVILSFTKYLFMLYQISKFFSIDQHQNCRIIVRINWRAPTKNPNTLITNLVSKSVIF